MKPEFFHLNLLHPLYYHADLSVSSVFTEPPECADGEETLFCFKVEGEAAGEFEPDRMFFPGVMVFKGVSSGKTKENNAGVEAEAGAGEVTLPEGNYLFTQSRERLGIEAVIDLAIEVQQETLWQRLTPGRLWYLRLLFEDGKPVTQILRPLLTTGTEL